MNLNVQICPIMTPEQHYRMNLYSPQISSPPPMQPFHHGQNANQGQYSPYMYAQNMRPMAQANAVSSRQMPMYPFHSTPCQPKAEPAPWYNNHQQNNNQQNHNQQNIYQDCWNQVHQDVKDPTPIPSCMYQTSKPEAHQHIQPQPSCAYSSPDPGTLSTVSAGAPSGDLDLDKLHLDLYGIGEIQLPAPHFQIPELNFDDVSFNFEDTDNSSSGVFSGDSEIWNDLSNVLNTADAFLESMSTLTDENKSNSLNEDNKENILQTKEENPGSCPAPTPESVSTCSENDSDSSGHRTPDKVQCESDSNATSPLDEKPPEPYLSLIAKAILSTKDQKMMLSDIYSYIYDSYSFFKDTKCAWRNSIRHNLSVNECFIKSSRGKNGRGYYWGIHPACLEDFIKGDYNRKLARRRVQSNTKKLEESIKRTQAAQANQSTISSALQELHTNSYAMGNPTPQYIRQRGVRSHPYATPSHVRVPSRTHTMPAQRVSASPYSIPASPAYGHPSLSSPHSMQMAQLSSSFNGPSATSSPYAGQSLSAAISKMPYTYMYR